MKMGINDFSANDVINKLEQKHLEKILKFFGDENNSRLISKYNKNKERLAKKIKTQDLVKIIEKSKKKEKL